MPIYKFQLCADENTTSYISETIESFGEAMQRAEHLAVHYGAAVVGSDIQGHFISVLNKQNMEVFRAPLGNARDAQQSRQVK